MPRAVRTIGVVVGFALAALLAFPARAGLTGTVPVAQLIAFRAVLALGLAALAVLLVALPGRRRRLALVAVVSVAALLQGVVLVDRGLASTEPGPSAARAGDLVVLASNTQTRARADDLAALVRATGAGVVVLPETSREVADDVVALLAASGNRMQVLAHGGREVGSSSTALLVSERLGEYRIDEVADTVLGTFVAVPVDGTGPALVAVHPSPPVRVDGMAAWRRGAAWATETCRGRDGAIVAGDFNATLDHPAFAGLHPCLDAARSAGAAGLGTWPSSAPSLLAAPIDHVLVDGRTWRVVSFAVLDAIPGSDHRPVVAHLSRR